MRRLLNRFGWWLVAHTGEFDEFDTPPDEILWRLRSWPHYWLTNETTGNSVFTVTTAPWAETYPYPYTYPAQEAKLRVRL